MERLFVISEVPNRYDGAKGVITEDELKRRLQAISLYVSPAYTTDDAINILLHGEKMNVPIHSVYTRCWTCGNFGINLPEIKSCGNCGSLDTTIYYPEEMLHGEKEQETKPDAWDEWVEKCPDSSSLLRDWLRACPCRQ